MRGWALGLLGLLFWFLVARVGVVPVLYLPEPVEVIRALRMELLVGAAASTGRSVFGFLVGILLAYTLHFFSLATGTVQALDSQFAASRAIPVIAAMPLFLLWFGFGETGRLLIVCLTGTMFFLAPLQGAFNALPREWTIQKEQVELSNFTYYMQVVVPGTAGSLRGAFRLVGAICFTIAIGSDYMGAQVGLGKFIDSSRVTFNVPGIFLAIIVSAGIGLLLDRIVVSVYERIVHWEGRTMKA